MTDDKPTTKNNHRSVLVPMETWEYNSPFIKYQGKSIDIGLFGEALLYYEQVYLEFITPKEFEDFVSWFVKQDKFELLLDLIKNGSLKFAHHAFMTSAVNVNGDFEIWNIQDPEQERGHTFLPRIVYKAELDKLLNSRDRAKLFKVIENNCLEEKSKDYDEPVMDTRNVARNAEKCQILVQAFVDDIYMKLNAGKPPKIECSIVEVSKEKWNISWNYDFNLIKNITNSKLHLRPDLPLVGEAHSNRLLWTASRNGLDLYMGDVMATVSGNKLEESLKTSKIKNVLEDLKEKVEFPDIHEGVNSGTISLKELMEIRKKANMFRNWLQSESERDRDSIIAYHNELAKKSGFIKFTSSSIKLFGYLGQIGAGVASVANPEPVTGLIAVGSGVAGKFLDKIAEKISQDWKPVIFGDWVRKKVDEKKNIP